LNLACNAPGAAAAQAPGLNVGSAAQVAGPRVLNKSSIVQYSTSVAHRPLVMQARTIKMARRFLFRQFRPLLPAGLWLCKQKQCATIHFLKQNISFIQRASKHATWKRINITRIRRFRARQQRRGVPGWWRGGEGAAGAPPSPALGAASSDGEGAAAAAASSAFSIDGGHAAFLGRHRLLLF